MCFILVTPITMIELSKPNIKESTVNFPGGLIPELHFQWQLEGMNFFRRIVEDISMMARENCAFQMEFCAKIVRCFSGRAGSGYFSSSLFNGLES